MTGLNIHYYLKNVNDVTLSLDVLLDHDLTYRAVIEPPRKYLGASRLGVPCSRALQYEYLKAVNGDYNPFANGNTHRIRNREIRYLFEHLMIDWLKRSGFRLVTTDAAGKRLGFKAADGKIAGHIDGIIIEVPSDMKDLARRKKGLKISCPMLWETKSMNNKSWRETFKKGLVLSNPVYAAQIALYQAYMAESINDISKNPCFFTAINKDTAEIYVELIPFDAELAQRMSDKAVNIIKATEAGELLPRHYNNPDIFECKMCSYRSKCWGIRRGKNLYE